MQRGWCTLSSRRRRRRDLRDFWISSETSCAKYGSSGDSPGSATPQPRSAYRDLARCNFTHAVRHHGVTLQGKAQQPHYQAGCARYCRGSVCMRTLTRQIFWRESEASGEHTRIKCEAGEQADLQMLAANTIACRHHPDSFFPLSPTGLPR